MNQEDYEEMQKTLKRGNRVLIIILIVIICAFITLKIYGKF